MHGFLEEGADELERAAEALAVSDPAAAALATVTRGEFIWQRGDQDGAFVYLDRARSLAEDASLSPQKQEVVAQVARFLSLAGRYEEALPLVEQAIDMAQELEDDELLGDALNTRGIVRASLGDRRWEEDSERSLELALRRHSFRARRAYINLASHLEESAGDLARAMAVTREGLAFSQRMGFSSTALRWFLGNLADMTFLAGAWDEALTLSERVIVGEAHYMQQVGFSVRADIRMARGDRRGAAEDVALVLQHARAIRDPQVLDPALVQAAHVAHRNGEGAAAHALIDELGSPERAAGTWVVAAALLHHDLGREMGALVGRRDVAGTPWSQAALAVANGDLLGAADILKGTGARTLEAAARLRAAQAYASGGRRTEAAEQFALALAFYREVGASAYVLEAEALLAAAS
jgi:tetratricopeptide (TPR) repeat protein